LDNNGVSGVLDQFFRMASDRRQAILYGTNISLQEPLRTTKDLSMDQIKSYMEHLPGGLCTGINVPGAFVGQDGTSFNPHIEDCAFAAINRHVAGAAKLW